MDRIGLRDIPKLEKPIWIHAVSVGEVLSIKPLMARLKQERPDLPMVLSTTTVTGQQVAQRGSMDALISFPLDIGYSVRRIFDRVRPQIVVMVETEIWPNFLRACFQRNIPVIWINGRISDKSYPRYRWIRFFLKDVFRHYAWIGMQSEEDGRRVIALGADPKRVTVMGNLKYDVGPGPSLPQILQEALIPIPPSPLWIAASTLPGEEEMIIQAFRLLRVRHPSLRLMMAPRHPERFDEVARLLEKNDLLYALRSRLPKAAPVLLLDSMGELAATFQWADLVFVGGSLIPHGGHNILEPAFYGKPILFGPHMENFRDMASCFLREDAAIEVQAVPDIVATVDLLLSEGGHARQMGQNAKKIVARHMGATEKVVSVLCERIGKKRV